MPRDAPARVCKDEFPDFEAQDENTLPPQRANMGLLDKLRFARQTRVPRGARPVNPRAGRARTRRKCAGFGAPDRAGKARASRRNVSTWAWTGAPVSFPVPAHP